MRTHQTRLQRITHRTKQPDIIIRDSKPELEDMVEGNPVYVTKHRHSTDGLIEYLKIGGQLYKRTFQLDRDVTLKLQNTEVKELIDNAGGTATPNGTIAEIENIALSTANTYNDGIINAVVNTVVDDCANAIEEVSTKLNELIVVLRKSGVIKDPNPITQ